jgi:hypothetical protein
MRHPNIRFAFQCFVITTVNQTCDCVVVAYVVEARVPSYQVRRLKLPIFTAQATHM